MVNPYDEEKLKEESLGITGMADLVRKKIEAIGSNISLTLIMDKLGLVSSIPDFSNNLSESEKKQFDYKKNQNNYRDAVYNETKNIYNISNDSQKNGMFKDIPYYIISNQDNNSLKRLGGNNLTFEYKSSYSGNVYSMMDSDSVKNSIKKVVEIARKIKKVNEKTN